MTRFPSPTTRTGCSVFTENTGEEQKKVFVVRDEAPHFLRGPRLQPGWPTRKSSLACTPYLACPHVTCPIYVGFRPTVLAFSFCSPRSTNKILKKTSLGICSFLGFNFDGRPSIKYIHAEVLL